MKLILGSYPLLAFINTYTICKYCYVQVILHIVGEVYIFKHWLILTKNALLGSVNTVYKISSRLSGLHYECR